MTALSSPVEYFKKSAKTLVKQVDEGLASALVRARAVFRDLSEKTDAEVAAAFGLMRAQHVVAVEHGFAKWENVVGGGALELRLAITLAKEPTLTDFGMGLHGDQGRLPKEQREAILREQREALRKSVDAVGKTIDWLQDNIQATKTINPKRSSYGLKQIVEKDIGYITNGVFIAAAIIAGYPCKASGDTPHPQFGMSERSIKEVERSGTKGSQRSSPSGMAKTRRATITVEEAAALVDGAKLVSVPGAWLDNPPATPSVWNSLYAWLAKEHGAVEKRRRDLHNRTFVGKELMDRLHAAEIKRIRRHIPTATKAEVERSASWSIGNCGPHELFVDQRKLTGSRLFFVPEDADVWGSEFRRRLEDPTKQANEAWRSLILHLKDYWGWQVVSRANHQAYYIDDAGMYGTLVLDSYHAVVWRWYVDSHDIRKRGKSESIKPQRPVLDGHDLGRTELTCAPEELVELSAWLADWLVAYRGQKPLPALPLSAEGWKRRASDRAVSPWGDNVWTHRARAVYAARYPRPSASAPNGLPSGSA